METETFLAIFTDESGRRQLVKKKVLVMKIVKINYGSSEYQETLALRDRIMRKPLGLDIFQEDFSQEAKALILGAYNEVGSGLLGVAVMSHQPEGWQAVDYLCVDTQLQSKGVGRKLLAELEATARKQGAQGIWLEARVSAKGFYEKLGYRSFGEVYEMPHAPVPHIKMDKIFPLS